MKVNFGILAVCFALSAHAAEHEQARISVTRFRQEVDHIVDGCRGWDFTIQDQLRTELERGLSRNGLKVLERQNIRDIYSDEYELPNLNQKTKPKTGKFLSAKYTVTGGITELGICEESSGNGIQLGGIVSLLGGPPVDFGASHHKSTSKVKVISQLVSVETGEILHSFEGASEINDSSFGVSGGAMGIGAGHQSRSQPPIEQATNKAIQNVSKQIAEYIYSMYN